MLADRELGQLEAKSGRTLQLETVIPSQGSLETASSAGESESFESHGSHSSSFFVKFTVLYLSPFFIASAFLLVAA